MIIIKLSEVNLKMCCIIGISIFSTASWANGQKLSVCMRVCVNQGSTNHNWHTYRLVLSHRDPAMPPELSPDIIPTKTIPPASSLQENFPRQTIPSRNSTNVPPTRKSPLRKNSPSGFVSQPAELHSCLFFLRGEMFYNYMSVTVNNYSHRKTVNSQH